MLVPWGGRRESPWRGPDVLESTNDDDGDVPWPAVGELQEDRPASTSFEVSSSPATSSLKRTSSEAISSSRSGEARASLPKHLLRRALAFSCSSGIRPSRRGCANASDTAPPSAS